MDTVFHLAPWTGSDTVPKATILMTWPAGPSTCPSAISCLLSASPSLGAQQPNLARATPRTVGSRAAGLNRAPFLDFTHDHGWPVGGAPELGIRLEASSTERVMALSSNDVVSRAGEPECQDVEVGHGAGMPTA